jgi:UV DNA damage repair endonuclease
MSNGRCHDCGRTFPNAVFDFHHVEAKEFTLNACSMDRSWKNIVEEWEKCIMLCANCHRICHNIGEYNEP